MKKSEPPDTPLYRLCEAWSEAEPYHCKRRAVGKEVTFMVTVDQDRVTADPNGGKYARAFILAAVLGRISKRGWKARLEYVPDPARWKAIVAVPGRNPYETRREPVGYGEHPHDSAHALLAAYLVAHNADLDARTVVGWLDEKLVQAHRAPCPACNRKGVGYAAHSDAYGWKDHSRGRCRYCEARIDFIETKDGQRGYRQLHHQR